MGLGRNAFEAYHCMVQPLLAATSLHPSEGARSPLAAGSSLSKTEPAAGCERYEDTTKLAKASSKRPNEWKL